MKLRSVIDSRLSKLGSTPSGADWCLKALHPADPLVEVRGIPDKSAVPSCFLNYQTVARVGPAEGATGTWSYDATMVPHPVSFMAHRVSDSVNPAGLDSATLNSQLPGETHLEKFRSFRAQCRRWRLAYMSITIHQDGPDLANQGTMVAAQVPVQPKIFNAGVEMRSDNAGGASEFGRSLICLPHYAMFTDLDRPNYEASQAMPNAYFNQSKHGAYIPLKLTETSQIWHSDTDNISILPYNSTADPDEAGLWYDKGIAIVGPGGGDPWPFPGLTAASVELPNSADTSTATTVQTIGQINGAVTSSLCNDTWAQVSARNMSVQTSLSIFIRCGFEVQVLPTSVLSPHQKLSPPHDEEALYAYFHIARELKDAYPEDFNGLGKILTVIGKAATTLSPFLAAIPKVGLIASPVASAIGGVLSAVGDGLSKKKAESGPKATDRDFQSTLSEAQRERMVEAKNASRKAARELVKANPKYRQSLLSAGAYSTRDGKLMMPTASGPVRIKGTLSKANKYKFARRDPTPSKLAQVKAELDAYYKGRADAKQAQPSSSSTKAVKTVTIPLSMLRK